MIWYVYILLCNDGTLYTGITKELSKRIDKHNKGQGAKYTKPRQPVKLLYSEPAIDRSSASRRERNIKMLSRSAKFELINQQSSKKS